MSAATRTALAFTAVTTVGALLPADMLLRIAEARNLPGTKSADYGMPASVPVRDEAERAWEYLKPLWRELRTALPADSVTGAPAADPTGRAGNDWLAQLFRKLDFGALTEVGPDGIPADADPDKHFPVSHRHGPALIHQIPWNQELDKRPAAGQVPAQSMLQDCLNRTEAHLWAVLTNGRSLRLLRDSSSFATAAYVEFDLEAIFDGELFSEFVLLYCVLHASRFEVAEGSAASGCWLEKWRTEAVTSGARALDQLRLGVQNALTVLGTGFLRHPENVRLRENTDPKALRDALLRLVYRLLFVFVAEDREALLDPKAGERQREAYERYFSSVRLRERARRRQGTAHGDQYEALRMVLNALGAEGGRPELGLPGLGGLFSHTETDTPLDGLKLSNESLLTAVRHLAQVRDPGARRWRPVDYRHLDAEELGSVYESLLELEPKHSATDRSFELIEVAGNSRKTTGSYYTPSSLIECLLDTTLDPVINDAVKRGAQRASEARRPDPADDIVDELLSLTVCDPACGSGHFLVASARRIAKRVAAVRERNPEPTVDAVRHALHEVVARCIYGVDLNPMAVELAKVSLWLEAMEPGKALGFLDAHVKHGNGLIGATPKLLTEGVPDDAFQPIEGDDRKYAAGFVKRNKAQRRGQDELLFDTDTLPGNERYAAELARITTARSDLLVEVRAQEDAYRAYTESTAYVQDVHAADAWCAAFVWPKHEGAPEAPTDQVFRALRSRNQSVVPDASHAEILRLRNQYSFFHWHLEFPEVFSVPESGVGVQNVTGWAGGFDAVVGNPPWDQVQVDAREFFAAKRVDIAEAANMTARNKKINLLATEDPELYASFKEEQRKNDGFKHFVHASGRFPLTAYGRLNTYSLFTEHARTAMAPRGRSGLIVPSGIATDSFNQYFFKDLVERGSLTSLFEFGNEDKLFAAVKDYVRFALLTMCGNGNPDTPISIVAKVRQVAQIADRSFTLTARDILLVNPNTGTCPVFRSRRDMEITLGVYRRVPVLLKEGATDGNPWGVKFQLMIMMNTDSDKFRTHEDLISDGWRLESNTFVKAGARMLPLYEAKMLHHYDHRFSTYENATEKQLNERTLPRFTVEQHQDPTAVPLPRYWVSEQDTPTGEFDKSGQEIKAPGVRSRLAARGWDREWVMGWRDICRASDERTMISSIAPAHGFGHPFPLAFPAAIANAPLLSAVFSSMVCDYVVRQKIGGTHLTFGYVYQIPVPTPDTLAPHVPFITARVLELTYTATDMTPFASDLGDTGTPFRWDPDRRAVIRAELDALFFHLYGITRDDTAYILDTFNVTRDNDIKAHGEYRTKKLILAEYDRMAAAGLSLETPLAEGECGTSSYRSTLTPPPGHGPRHG
ncbi:N-6 DNA methylase [Streptomyces europaeiscabiei]|uniref:site-specific DNA-methyltransferase (adenine-specific) n=1 Tax=Streptomyces europaeiscabiei TaxID=146819 RepID=A0ABU4N7R4_9ACTN|nr:DNA methyltransferase [Streptomyces europaeiscabiei]MDX3542496.1 N-6 DNA methylase [Streptomyces europaeiscabiei]MDX3550362.1 N-6 DNA methylase [Streptomyces europaeiscabiei]MDX3699078.1 N-6 DNA methylase [Streptomyces europaeiscabiei]